MSELSNDDLADGLSEVLGHAVDVAWVVIRFLSDAFGLGEGAVIGVLFFVALWVLLD